MADQYYVAQYSTSTGYVVGMWLRGGPATTSNASTADTDGYLEIESVKVLDGVGSRTDTAFVTLLNPTDTETNLDSNILEVDSTTTPTDTSFRTDTDKNPDYDFP